MKSLKNILGLHLIVLCLGVCCDIAFAKEGTVFLRISNGVLDGECSKKGWLDHRLWSADDVDLKGGLLRVGHTGGYGWHVGQLEFPLEQLPKNIKIKSAVLKLWTRSWAQSEVGLNVIVFNHTPGKIDKDDYSSSFDQSFFSNLAIRKAGDLPKYNTWKKISIDLTEDLAGALRAGRKFFSVILERTNPKSWDGGFFEIASSEDKNKKNRPVLIVKYDDMSDTAGQSNKTFTPNSKKNPTVTTLSPLKGLACIPTETSLSDYVRKIGNQPLGILIDREMKIKSDLVIPQNITLFFAPPGSFVIDKGKTVVISGQISAPAVPCFKGDGKILIKNHNSVYADWWSPDGDGIQKAIDSIESGKVVLLDKVYQTTKSVKGKKGIYLTGAFTHEIWRQDNGTVIEYVGDKPVPVLDFRGATWFGARNFKIVGHKRASHGLVTGHRGMCLRAKHSEIDHLFIYQCGIGLDLGGTDDITVSYLEIFNCHIGLSGAHTQVRFYECSFVGCDTGFEIMNASKCYFYKCLWCSNLQTDLLLSTPDHPGGTYTFRDCWFENVGGTIMKLNPALKRNLGMGRYVFDVCKLHDYGYAFIDATGVGKYGCQITMKTCDIPPTCSSFKIIDPKKKVTVVGIPSAPAKLDAANIYECRLEKRGSAPKNK